MGSMWSCGTRIDCWSASSHFCRGDDQAILSADGQVHLQLLRMQHRYIQLDIHGCHITRCDQPSASLMDVQDGLIVHQPTPVSGQSSCGCEEHASV